MSDDHKYRHANAKLALSAVMTLLTVLAAIFIYTHGCGAPKKTLIQETASPPPALPSADPACPDGSVSGTTRTVACPAGQSGSDVQVCAKATWHDAVNTCAVPPPPPPSGCTVPVFADVAPIFESKCVSCHAVLATFAGTQQFGPAELGRRVGLPITDADHMPEVQAPQLVAEQITEIQAWVAGGANNACPSGPTPTPVPVQPTTVTLQAIDQTMVQDALSLSAGDRPFTRYLVTAGAINDGITGAGLSTFTEAMNKGLNSLNDSGQDLVPAKKVGTGVWRVDLRNYGIGLAEIAAVDAADVLNIVDNTATGVEIQALVNDKHAWFPADDFLETAFRNPSVYYTLLNVPATLTQYQAQVGVNFAHDLASLPTNGVNGQPQISFIGAVGQITEQKNRLLVRDVQAQRLSTAYYWQTFDVNAVAKNVSVNGKLENTKNLFQFPLLTGTGAQVTLASVANFTHDASETIVQLPNGMQGYGLWDGNGNRLNVADPNVVIDTETPLSNHVIAVGITCSRCHNDGSIPLVDKVLNAVTSSADQFTANDVQLVQAVYHGATTNAALFMGDTAAFAAALAKLGIKPGPDPQNVVGDRFQENWTLSQLAGELLLTQPQLTSCINGSARTKVAIGELTTGGTAPEADIVSALPGLIADCRLFQDPIAQ